MHNCNLIFLLRCRLFSFHWLSFRSRLLRFDFWLGSCLLFSSHSFLEFSLGFLLSVVSIEISFSHLAFIIPAPAVDFTVLGKSNRVMFTAINLHDFNFIFKLDQSRFWCVPSVSDTQLSVVVLAKTHQPALFIHVERGVLAAEDVLHS